MLLVDADPQASARDWNDKNNGALLDVAPMDSDALAHDLRSVEGYDWVVIDGAPRLTPLIESSIGVSDIILIPVQPSPVDIWATSELVQLVMTKQQSGNNSIKAAFVLNRLIASTNASRQVRAALGAQAIPLLKSTLSQRIIYSDSLGNGGTILSPPTNRAAISEITSLRDETIKLLNTSREVTEVPA